MESGILQLATTTGMGILSIPSGAAILNFLQSDIPRYAGETLTHLRFVIVLAGLVVGVLVGMTGVGGGILLTPLLIFLGVRPTIAVGTDLFYASVTKMVGIQEHRRRRSIRWDWVLYMGMGSIPASLIASYLVHYISLKYASAEEIMHVALGVVLLFSAGITLFNEIYWKSRRRADDELQVVDPKSHAVKVILLGVLVGFMVGLTSLGSGAIVAVALVAFSGLPGASIVGTDIAHALILTSSASIAHWHFGTVDLNLAINLLIGSIPGAMVGSRMAYFVPSRPLKVGMAILVLAGGLRMFV